MYEKTIRKVLKNWKESRDSTLFILALIISIFGINLFLEGFHDFDNAQNIIFLRDDITIELLKNNINYTMGSYLETTIGGEIITLEYAYVSGVKKILSSIFLVMGGFFIMGYYFRRLEEKK